MLRPMERKRVLAAQHRGGIPRRRVSLRRQVPSFLGLWKAGMAMQAIAQSVGPESTLESRHEGRDRAEGRGGLCSGPTCSAPRSCPTSAAADMNGISEDRCRGGGQSEAERAQRRSAGMVGSTPEANVEGCTTMNSSSSGSSGNHAGSAVQRLLPHESSPADAATEGRGKDAVRRAVRMPPNGRAQVNDRDENARRQEGSARDNGAVEQDYQRAEGTRLLHREANGGFARGWRSDGRDYDVGEEPKLRANAEGEEQPQRHSEQDGLVLSETDSSISGSSSSGSRSWSSLELPCLSPSVVDSSEVDPAEDRFSGLSEHRQGAYDYTKSTEDNHRVDFEAFADRFREARSLLDYSYHSHYPLARQQGVELVFDIHPPRLCSIIRVDPLRCQLQDDIIQRALRTETPGNLDSPWAVFTAGAMGAGKSHVMRLLSERGIFPMHAFVQVDPDRLRRDLPEMEAYLERDSATAGSLTHKEAGLMAEILEETALLQGRNILVDGSMRDAEWYALHVKDLRNRFPRLRVAIIHVWAPEEEVQARAARRAKHTGRVIPPSILQETIRAVPRSVETLAPLADYCVRIDNVGDEHAQEGNLDCGAQQSKQANPSLSAFACEGGRGPTCGGTAGLIERGAISAGSGGLCAAEPRSCDAVSPSSSPADGGSLAVSGSSLGDSGGGVHMDAGFPCLATPGETWQSFRKTFDH